MEKPKLNETTDLNEINDESLTQHLLKYKESFESQHGKQENNQMCIICHNINCIWKNFSDKNYIISVKKK